MNYAEHYLFAIFFAKQHQQFCTFCQLRVLVHTDPKKFQKLVAIYIHRYVSIRKKYQFEFTSFKFWLHKNHMNILNLCQCAGVMVWAS